MCVFVFKGGGIDEIWVQRTKMAQGEECMHTPVRVTLCLDPASVFRSASVSVIANSPPPTTDPELTARVGVLPTTPAYAKR
jgi:hypothetical protein